MILTLLGGRRQPGAAASVGAGVDTVSGCQRRRRVNLGPGLRLVLPLAVGREAAPTAHEPRGGARSPPPSPTPSGTSGAAVPAAHETQGGARSPPPSPTPSGTSVASAPAAHEPRGPAAATGRRRTPGPTPAAAATMVLFRVSDGPDGHRHLQSDSESPPNTVVE